MKYLLGTDEKGFTFYPAATVFSTNGKLYNDYLRIRVSSLAGLCYDEYFMHSNWVYETQFKWLVGGSAPFDKLVKFNYELALLFCQHFPIGDNSEISVSHVGFKVWRKDCLQESDRLNINFKIYE